MILGRVDLLRWRLNSLGLQRVAFATLTVLATAAGLAMLSALWLGALTFLFVAVVLAAAGLAVLGREISRGWRSRSDLLRAALIADQRADLKGRLATVVSLAERPGHGRLWPYLIEDTVGRRRDFAPARIESHRVSRAILPMIAALAFAAIVLPYARHASQRSAGSDAGQQELSVDLQSLHVRPAEPGSGEGTELSADPATIAALEERMAEEGAAGANASGGALGALLDRTRDVASNLQNKLTGRRASRPRLRLRLADASDRALRPQSRRRVPRWRGDQSRERAGQFRQERGFNKPHGFTPRFDRSEVARAGRNRSGMGGVEGLNSGGRRGNADADDGSADRHGASSSRETPSPSGTMHGVGADPEGLFGEPMKTRLGNEGFEIAIEARPLARGATGAGRAYLPPKVKTPLSSRQHPDEPVARAAVPAELRTTIKRVFER